MRGERVCVETFYDVLVMKIQTLTFASHASQSFADQATREAQENYLLFVIKQWSPVRSFLVYTVYYKRLQVY